jgi:hypothetical protein
MPGTVNQALALVRETESQDEFTKRPLVKEAILDYFFRCESLVDNNGKFVKLNYFLVESIAKETQISRNLVFEVMEQFLERVVYFKQFLGSGLVAGASGKQQLYRKVRVYLHKTHRLAPVFDYGRAKKNLELLHVLLGRSFFWPHMTTQLALLIFVTDRNDPDLTEDNYILQKNLRALCSCSAYAFHMARNKLGINKKGVLGLPKQNLRKKRSYKIL